MAEFTDTHCAVCFQGDLPSLWSVALFQEGKFTERAKANEKKQVIFSSSLVNPSGDLQFHLFADLGQDCLAIRVYQTVSRA